MEWNAAGRSLFFVRFSNRSISRSGTSNRHRSRSFPGRRLFQNRHMKGSIFSSSVSFLIGCTSNPQIHALDQMTDLHAFSRRSETFKNNHDRYIKLPCIHAEAVRSSPHRRGIFSLYSSLKFLSSDQLFLTYLFLLLFFLISRAYLK